MLIDSEDLVLVLTELGKRFKESTQTVLSFLSKNEDEDAKEGVDTAFELYMSGAAVTLEIIIKAIKDGTVEQMISELSGKPAQA